MRDECVTLTNAHADHEEYQGPGGRAVARAAGAFVPSGATVVTAEEVSRTSAQHVEDLLGLTANVNYSNGASRARFLQIRGIKNVIINVA